MRMKHHQQNTEHWPRDTMGYFQTAQFLVVPEIRFGSLFIAGVIQPPINLNFQLAPRTFRLESFPR